MEMRSGHRIHGFIHTTFTKSYEPPSISHGGNPEISSTGKIVITQLP